MRHANDANTGSSSHVTARGASAVPCVSFLARYIRPMRLSFAVRLAGAASFSLAFVGCSRPVTIDSPTSLPAGAITIIAPRMLDGRGGIRTNVRLVIEGSKIVRIDDGIASSTAATWDLRGLTVLPGLIDVHDHVGWYFNASGRFHSGNDGDTPAQSTAAAMENLRVTVLNGFTTVQSPGAATDAALRDSVNNGAVGPRLLSSLGQISGGTPEQLRDRVRRFKTQGADLVKIFASASIREGGRQTMTQEQLDAACGEAKTVGIRTMVHAHSAESMRAAALAGCDEIEHGIFATKDVLELMAQRGTWFSPQCGLVFHNYLENRDRYLGIGNYTDEGFAAMEKAIPLAIQGYKDAIATRGLRVVFGTDAVAGAHGRNVEELLCRVQAAEQPPMDAIVGATSVSAASMGLGSTIGTLAPGFEADIIAVDGNPLDDIGAMRRVVFVMKGGRVFRNDRAAR